MSKNIRLPKITATTEAGKLQQMQSYMYQLVEQLNWALNTIDSDGNGVVVQQGKTGKTVSAADMNATIQNFNDLKGLIIKSADIVNAYYEEINTRLEGLYVAQSDYGTFVEQTNASITQNSKNTTTNYENIQLLSSTVLSVETELGASIANTREALEVSIADTEASLQGNIDTAKKELEGSIAATEANLEGNIATAKEEMAGDIRDSEDRLKGMIDDATAILVEVQAHIKSGLLYYDDNGIPVYGLEIGQQNTVNGVETFDKFARFSSDKLSFYDANDTEVAYISDYKLVITHAEILGNLKLGKYIFDTADGLALRWEG